LPRNETANVWPRRPARIDMHPVSAPGSIAAQVLYVYGRTQQPDPRPIDRALRWRPGHVMSEFDATCYLMNEGFNCQFFTNTTDEDLVARGLASIKAHYGAEWGRHHERYYTPSMVRRLQEAAAADIRRKLLYKGLYDEQHNVGPTDVTRHLSQGHVVSFMTTGRKDKLFQQKALLVPDADKRSAWLYVIEVDGRPMVPGRASFAEMVRRVRYDVSVIAYWPHKQ